MLSDELTKTYRAATKNIQHIRRDLSSFSVLIEALQIDERISIPSGNAGRDEPCVQLVGGKVFKLNVASENLREDLRYLAIAEGFWPGQRIDLVAMAFFSQNLRRHRGNVAYVDQADLAFPSLPKNLPIDLMVGAL